MKGTWQTTDSGGSGIGTGVLVVLAAVLIAAVAGPVIRAAVDLIEVLAITAAVLAAWPSLPLPSSWRTGCATGRRARPSWCARFTPVTLRAAQVVQEPRAAIEAPGR